MSSLESRLDTLYVKQSTIDLHETPTVKSDTQLTMECPSVSCSGTVSLPFLKTTQISPVLPGADIYVTSGMDIASTTKALVPPRMTTAQRDAIASPEAGSILYNTTTSKLECYSGETWNALF